MTVKVEGENLVITMPINKPLQASSTGKNKLVASTHGNVPTPIHVEGKTLTVSVNAYIKNDAYVKVA